MTNGQSRVLRTFILGGVVGANVVMMALGKTVPWYVSSAVIFVVVFLGVDTSVDK